MAESNLVVLSNEIRSISKEFNNVLVSDEIDYAREARFAMQMLEGNDYLTEIAVNDKSSFRNAIINIAAIGISLNPALKCAYLVPRKGKACLDISYMGLTRLATDSGSIKWAQAEIVRAKDTFTFNGIGTKPTHIMEPFSDRGEIIGVYSVAKTIDGDYLCGTMPIKKCYRIRDRSEAYKKKKAGPWVSDEEEMIKKTIIKRDYKMWPKSDRMAQAVDIINQTDGIDFNSEIRDVTPPEDSLLQDLKNKLASVDNGEVRLLKHLSIKDKMEISKLEDLSRDQVKYSINFLSNKRS